MQKGEGKKRGAEAKTKQSSLLAFFASTKAPVERERTSGRKRPAPPTPSPGGSAKPAKRKPEQYLPHPREEETKPAWPRERGWRQARGCTDDSARGCIVYEDGEGGRLLYWPTFLSTDEATQLFAHLRDSTEWSQGGRKESSPASTTTTLASRQQIDVIEKQDATKEGEWMRGRATYTNTHGQVVSTPRLQKHYGRGITGGSKFRCAYREWPAELWDMKMRVEEVTGHPYNFLLLNFYRNENDYMSLHTDAGPFLGVNPAIASLSVGAARRFVLHYADNKAKPSVPRFELNLAHGSLLIMEGSTQHRWLHSVPKVRAITGGRINLTFRFVLDQYGDDGEAHLQQPRNASYNDRNHGPLP